MQNKDQLAKQQLDSIETEVKSENNKLILP